MIVADYDKKVRENITKDYRKLPAGAADEVTREAAQIAREYGLEDRIDVPTEDEAFITIKDHKDSFPGKVECRLINPAKNHIGAISKGLLDNINNSLRVATQYNQWQNTNSVIEWFNNIPDKAQKTFFKFDIVSFYPSIQEKLFMDAINWAKSLTNISKDEVNIILHCRKMFLFYQNECWVKKDNQDFDVSMGSLDSAEVCELVGLFLISQLERFIPKSQIGLYRDDGLAVVNLPGPEVERLRKNVSKLFASHKLKVTTEVNIRATDFLDVCFNLSNGSYKPYRKDAGLPTYINKSSNHPPHIKKELPTMIGKRISDLSSNKTTFLEEAPIYNQALRSAGYEKELQYAEKKHFKNKNRRRKKKVLWFNPPWNDGVQTNVARKFLLLVDKHFPKGSEFNKYFNRNTVKVSYSAMPNMAQTISGHNKKVTKSNKPLSENGCNCRKPKDCALNGKCLTENVVYKCSVISNSNKKEYIGLTSTSFKQRFTAHKASFTHPSKSHNTTLSTHIWELKNKNVPFTTSWSILGLAPSYSKNVRKCQLCLTEKTYISLADPSSTLNKRNEIISKCRHRDRLLLKHR